MHVNCSNLLLRIPDFAKCVMKVNSVHNTFILKRQEKAFWSPRT